MFLTVLLRNNNSSDKLGSEYLMVDVSVRFVGFILVGGVGGIYYVVSEGESGMEWCYDGGAAVVAWSY